MFNLKAPNGRIILTSERYKTKASALNGIKSVKTNAKKKGAFDRRKKNSGPYFVLVARNNEIIGRSEIYSSSTGVTNGIASVQKNAPAGKIEDLT